MPISFVVANKLRGSGVINPGDANINNFMRPQSSSIQPMNFVRNPLEVDSVQHMDDSSVLYQQMRDQSLLVSGVNVGSNDLAFKRPSTSTG